MATKPDDDKGRSSSDGDTEQVFTRDEDEAGKKALQRERKARREAETAARSLQERLDELEAGQKSDVERLQADVSRLTGERDAAVTRTLKLEIAIDKGLTAGQLKRLVGETREDLEADADEILTEFPTAAQRAAAAASDNGDGDGDGADGDGDGSDTGDRDGAGGMPSRRPASDLRGGSDPTSAEHDEMDPAKLAANIPRP